MLLIAQLLAGRVVGQHVGMDSTPDRQLADSQWAMR
jgi:hypothetical protein